MTYYGSQRAQLVVDQYRRTFEGDDETILIQTLGDLIEWCDEKHIDFDLTVQSAREMLRDVR